MKKSLVIFICLLVFVLGCALGYHIGRRKDLRILAEMDQSSLERAQENSEFEARAYFHCLQAIDSGDVTNLHEFALGHLRYYVSDVRQSRDEGYTWAPHIPALYSNATIYVAEHPRQK
jgi:cell division protein FtsL